MVSRQRMVLIVLGIILAVSGIVVGGAISDWMSTLARKSFRLNDATGVASISRLGNHIYARYDIHKGGGQTIWQQELGKFENQNSAKIQIDQTENEVTFQYGEESVKASLTPIR